MNGLKRLGVIAAIALGVSSVVASAQAPTSYRLTLIHKRLLDPASENDEFEITGINDKGQLSGYRIDSAAFAGFIWRNGEFRYLNPSSEALFSQASGINDWSEVAGHYVAIEPTPSQGYFWKGGRFTIIEAAPGETITTLGINNRRQVLVHGHGQDIEQYFIWRRGQRTALELLPGESTTPERINDRGIVVGSSRGATSVPVLWEDGEVMPLALPAGETNGHGVDINDDNTVLVNAGNAQRSQVYLWRDGQYTPLPVLAGGSSPAGTALNNSGVVVGTTVLSPFTVAAAWYGQQPVDLNTRVRNNDPLKPFVSLHLAVQVNDRGEIVARGQDSRDFDAERPSVNYYLLTPID